MHATRKETFSYLEHHGELLARLAAGGDLHHDRLAVPREEGRDEDEEDVVEEEDAEQDGADHEGGHAQHVQHVDAEQDAQEVL